MNTCQTCKWWNPPRKFRGVAGDTLWIEELGECWELGIIQHMLPFKPRFETKRLITDASIAPGSYLRTGPEFGCTHWEAKLAKASSEA